MPNIILRSKKEKTPKKQPASLEDSYKADVRLRLLKTRLNAIATLFEPNTLKELSNGGSDDSLANQLFKAEFAATVGHRLGDKVKVSNSANEAWRKLLLLLKIAERKYGIDHPWTQMVFEVVCNVAKKRAYYSIKSDDTNVEIARLPLDLMTPPWRRKSTSLAQ